MSFDDVLAFFDVQTKSNKFPEHTFGKSTKKRVRRYFHLFFTRSNGDFRKSFDDVFVFNDIQTKSKKFLEHTIGKNTKKRVQR